MCAQSAEIPRNLVNAAVALMAVLGSRTVEMPVMHILITHGPRASRLAKVSCREAHLCYGLLFAYCLLK